jgi:hypothetical protein
MTKAEKAALQKLEGEYILLNELHQMLTYGGTAALRNGGICHMSYEFKLISEMPLDPSIFHALRCRIIRDLLKEGKYSGSFLFRRGLVWPRLKWLKNEMVTVEKEAQKLLACG